MAIDVQSRLASLARTEWPEQGLEFLGCCPVCGAAERRTLYRDMLDVTFFCAPGKWVLHQCGCCSTAYLDPRPTESAIGLAYERYYTHQARARATANELGRLMWIRRAVANDYRNWRFGASLTPRVWWGRYLVRAMPSFRSALDRGGRYLSQKRGRALLLDFGCGNGEFLDDALALGWCAEGVEPDAAAAAGCISRGHAVCSSLDQLEALKRGPFDAVTLSHVIEHVHRPRELLERLVRLLVPGGALFVETPNLDALGHERYGPAWRGLEVPRHLCLFSWRGMETLLHECGLIEITRYSSSRDFAGLVARSRAIRAGGDPAAVFGGPIDDKLQAIFALVAVTINPMKSEFVTLTARRPA